MIRFLVTLALLGALVYAGATVKLGKHTLFGHIRAIWHTEEVQDLKEGVKETAGPAVDRVKRGVKAGLHAMEEDDAGGDLGSGAGSGSGSGSAAAPVPEGSAAAGHMTDHATAQVRP